MPLVDYTRTHVGQLDGRARGGGRACGGPCAYMRGTVYIHVQGGDRECGCVCVYVRAREHVSGAQGVVDGGAEDRGRTCVVRCTYTYRAVTANAGVCVCTYAQGSMFVQAGGSGRAHKGWCASAEGTVCVRVRGGFRARGTECSSTKLSMPACKEYPSTLFTWYMRENDEGPVDVGSAILRTLLLLRLVENIFL